MSGACNAAGGRNDAFGARKSPRGPATLGPSGTRTLGATETRHSIQCRPTGTPPFGQYADFETFDSKSLWAAQRRKFFKTAVGGRLLAMYHPHSHGPPTSLSLFKTKRPRRPLRQMPTKSPQSRPTAHATADAHVRCLPSPQTHSLGKILKNGSGRQEKSGEKSQLELEK